MNQISKWLLGIAMAIVALAGLVVASRAEDDALYLGGLLFFLFGVLFNFGLAASSETPPPAPEHD